MLTLNGKVLQYDREFQVNGVIYPKNWLRNSTLEEKKAIGISETPPPIAFDRQFYTAPGVARNHAKLVVDYVSAIHRRTNDLLSTTDWQVVRAADPSAASHTAVDPAVLARRTTIRTLSNEKEAAVKATTTVEELITYVKSSEYYTWSGIE